MGAYDNSREDELKLVEEKKDDDVHEDVGDDAKRWQRASSPNGVNDPDDPNDDGDAAAVAADGPSDMQQDQHQHELLHQHHPGFASPGAGAVLAPSADGSAATTSPLTQQAAAMQHLAAQQLLERAVAAQQHQHQHQEAQAHRAMTTTLGSLRLGAPLSAVPGAVLAPGYAGLAGLAVPGPAVAGGVPVGPVPPMAPAHFGPAPPQAQVAALAAAHAQAQAQAQIQQQALAQRQAAARAAALAMGAVTSSQAAGAGGHGPPAPVVAPFAGGGVPAPTIMAADPVAAAPLLAAMDPAAQAAALAIVANPAAAAAVAAGTRPLAPQLTVPHYVPPIPPTWGAQIPALTVQDRPLVPPVYNGINPNYPGASLLHAHPPIFAVDNFLTPAECDFLIEASNDALGPAPVVGKGSGEVSPSRTSSTCYLAREDLPEYLRKVSLLTGKPAEHCELPQVGRYFPSQQYLQHFDAFDLSNDDGRRFASNGGQRTVTVLVYLNDVARGGSTAFPNLNVEVRPRRGMALVFFPATLDGLLDKMALHAALPAVDIKYVSQVWIRQGNYEGRPSKRLAGPMVAGLQERRDAMMAQAAAQQAQAQVAGGPGAQQAAAAQMAHHQAQVQAQAQAHLVQQQHAAAQQAQAQQQGYQPHPWYLPQEYQSHEYQQMTG